jgi:hypothetical protein
MMEPALAAHAEIEARLLRLTNAAKSYTPSSENAEAIETRMEMISQANGLVRALTSPVDIGALLMAQVFRTKADLTDNTYRL